MVSWFTAATLRRDTGVFDLTMDDDEGHSILDPQYAPSQRKLRLCGMDGSRLQRCMPCLSCSAPDWWYSRCAACYWLACVGLHEVLQPVAMLPASAQVITRFFFSQKFFYLWISNPIWISRAFWLL